MKKELVMTLIRALLSAAGAFLLGKNIFGIPADSNTIQIIIGVIMAAGSTVWSIVDKSATIEKIEAGLRSIFTLGGGLLVSLGKLSAESVNTYMGLSITLATFIYSLVSKNKTQLIASGKLVVMTDSPPLAAIGGKPLPRAMAKIKEA